LQLDFETEVIFDNDLQEITVAALAHGFLYDFEQFRRHECILGVNFDQDHRARGDEVSPRICLCSRRVVAVYTVGVRLYQEIRSQL